MGYVLGVGPIMKGYHYSMQVQTTPNNMIRIRAFHTKVHRQFKTLEQSSHPVKLECVHSADGNMKFTSSCKVYQAFPSDVNFQLNVSQREQLQLEKRSRSINVKDLLNVDARTNQEQFTLKEKVLIGNEGAEPINTSYGQATIKRGLKI